MVESETPGLLDDEVDTSGLSILTAHDGAPALVAAAPELDPDREYTRSDLSDVANVDFKTLYMSDALEALVDAGLFLRHDGEEPTFSVQRDAGAYAAVAALDEALSAD